MTEQAANILLKAGVIFMAWANYAYQEIGGNIDRVVSDAFELTFSLGVLVMIVIYFIYENRMKDQKKDDIQKSMVVLLEKNITAINNFSQSNKDMTKTLERLQESNVTAMNNLADAFNKMENKL